MGSKKHKKHKTDRKEKYDDPQFSLERTPGLKLILKVGGNSSTPEHSNDSPGPFYTGGNEDGLSDLSEKHKKAKKKKKKKDREKKHKHHKEKRRRHNESSQEETSMGEESLLEPPKLNNISTLSQADESVEVREPRTCVLRQRQERSPLGLLLEHLLRALEKRDQNQFFAWPVTDNIAPGYSSIITNPMDFSTMKQKIDDGIYTSMMEFIDDFKLMCENALRYNHSDTVYHKAAKKLLHVGMRLLQPDKLRALRPLLVFMSDIPSEQLGFELCKSNSLPESPVTHKVQASEPVDVTPAASAMEVDDHPSPECVDTPHENEMDIEEKRRLLRIENWPKSKFEPFVDDLTPQEILEQAQSAAKTARNKLLSKKCSNNLGFLRQNKDGTTSMKIILDSGDDGPERPISLGAFIGKLSQGSGHLQGFREDRRNLLKPVKPLDYGQFSSFAPIYDSRFANLTAEETQLVLQTYGDETGAQYADSILEFTKDSPYASSLAGNLLDLLTSGEHRKTYAKIQENQKVRTEQKELEKMFSDYKQEIENLSMDIDMDALRSLSELGIDVSFLESLEKEAQQRELAKQLQEQLDNNAQMLENLQQVQNDRLSLPLPQHLSQLPQPSNNEVTLANQITMNLTNMAKKVNPSDVAPVQSLRKAMGVGEKIQTINMETQTGSLISPGQKSLGNSQIIDVEEATTSFSVANSAVMSQSKTCVTQTINLGQTNVSQVRPVMNVTQSNVTNVKPRIQMQSIPSSQPTIRTNIISGNMQKQVVSASTSVNQPSQTTSHQLMAVRGPRVLQRPQNPQVMQQNLLLTQQQNKTQPSTQSPPARQQVVMTTQSKPIHQNQVQQVITTQAQNPVHQIMLQQVNPIRHQIVGQQRVVQRPLIRAQQQQISVGQQLNQQIVQQIIQQPMIQVNQQQHANNQQQQNIIQIQSAQQQQQQSQNIIQIHQGQAVPQQNIIQIHQASSSGLQSGNQQQQTMLINQQQTSQRIPQPIVRIQQPTVRHCKNTHQVKTVQQVQQQLVQQALKQQHIVLQQQQQQLQLNKQSNAGQQSASQQIMVKPTQENKQQVVVQQVLPNQSGPSIISATVGDGSTPPTIHISAQGSGGVDLESELREYLESGGVLTADQDATIAQILME